MTLQPLETLVHSRMFFDRKHSKTVPVFIFSILFMLLAFFVWAAMMKMDDVVKAQALLRPVDTISIIRCLAGGEVQVKQYHQNAVVSKGDLLFQLDTTSDTLEARRKAFQDLVNSEEYKDIYTEETQRIINRRFRETQNLEQQVARNQPLIDMLMQRYKISDGDIGKLTAAIENDDAYWSEAAEEAGMSVEQYKQFQKLQRENAALMRDQQQRRSQQAAQQQLQKWYGEAEQVKGVYPSFDLNAEVKNQQFLSMLKSGVPMQHAYEVVHLDDIKAGVAKMQAKATERQVVDGIRAKGARPQENGTTSQSAFTVKDDVGKLTKAERAEIARRVARGEIIKF